MNGLSSILASMLKWVIISTTARMFAGIGLALTSQAFLTSYANDALLAMVGLVNGMGGDVGQLFLMMGFGSFLSIVGTALLTRVTIVQAAKVFGVTVE